MILPYQYLSLMSIFFTTYNQINDPSGDARLDRRSGLLETPSPILSSTFSATAISSSATAVFGARTGRINLYCPSLKLFIVQAVNCRLGGSIIGHLYEPKSF
jgi:hypothetical protein